MASISDEVTGLASLQDMSSTFTVAHSGCDAFFLRYPSIQSQDCLKSPSISGTLAHVMSFMVQGKLCNCA